ncbi:hypothetical protein DPMN_153357 [Dreissena polymorpha]|uniref:Sacsin/Nov domain-containing protein n=1 Tax=Dreissena polymorpha TaxID=45954 RepID=A0A9D4J8U9_DREPO|nr:hypothetical protein DPMN_153357 [Dreissena polymorpha]
MASSSGGPRKRRPDFSCMEQPPLIKQLRGILSEYPDGGQILKELMQNADDAGASELKIMLESRRINRNLTDESPEYTKFFQAPALCIFNDAEFTEEDWRGIRMIYSSVKEEDSLKVGRFGLGFKSVFHMTDYPCVISGDTMLLIDPHRPAHEVNAKLKINEIHEIEGMETSDLLRAIGGKYGFDKSVVDKGYFRGTMFWFPLREKASQISEDVYDVGKVEKLFGSLSAESSSILIFLKSLVRLQLLKMSQSGNEEHVLRVHIQNEKEIQTSRQSFFSCVKSASSKQAVSCVFTMTIKEETATVTSKLTKWLVVNYCIVHNATNDFKRLIQSPKLGLSPCVGVAAKIEPFSAVDGHIFCFLPLPKEGSKLTGLPFHVNGFFALSQNRHHLKWETDDQDHQYVSDEILWNKKLLTEALPLAFQKALDTSISNADTYGNKASLVDGVYLWIPNLETVLDKWNLFFMTALQLFEDKNIVFCEHFNSWKRVSDAVFTTFSNLPHKFEFVKAPVRKAIGSCGQFPVVVPEHVFLTLNLLFGRQIIDISPLNFADILRNNATYKNMTDKDKQALVAYLTSERNIHTLEGLDLLLLASGEWGTFKHNGSTKYICSEIEVNMFQGSERIFIMPYARLDQCTKEAMHLICEQSKCIIVDDASAVHGTLCVYMKRVLHHVMDGFIIY